MSISPVSQEIMELCLNNSICEAVGCSNKATVQLAVKVGPERNIQLFLCKYCVSKFEECKNVRKASTKQA
jgi:hypothetical protein